MGSLDGLLEKDHVLRFFWNDHMTFLDYTGIETNNRHMENKDRITDLVLHVIKNENHCHKNDDLVIFLFNQ